MNEQQKDLPAFPEKRFDVFGHSVDTKGMTLRDYFAAKAMAAIVAKFPAVTVYNEEEDLDLVETARGAYAYADAMLKARESR